jgi:hypothetical protein
MVISIHQFRALQPISTPTFTLPVFLHLDAAMLQLEPHCVYFYLLASLAFGAGKLHLKEAALS